MNVQEVIEKYRNEEGLAFRLALKALRERPLENAVERIRVLRVNTTSRDSKKIYDQVLKELEQ